VRVIERGEDLRFTLEPRKAIPVSGESGREYLQRHLPPQSGVGRAVYLPHAALSDEGLHFVDAETRAGSEHWLCEWAEYTAAPRHAAAPVPQRRQRQPQRCPYYPGRV
jgi:hypothetical protein